MNQADNNSDSTLVKHLTSRMIFSFAVLCMLMVCFGSVAVSLLVLKYTSPPLGLSPRCVVTTTD